MKRTIDESPGKVADPALYTREMMEACLYERVGDEYDLLKDATVVIAGCGGLGSNIALSLTRSGVGHLRVIDYDVVEASNLNRQQYRVSDLGRPKAEALAEILGLVNPYADVVYHNERVGEDNFSRLFAGADVIIEAFDDAAAKAMLVQLARSEYPDVPLICGSGMAGIGPANWIESKRVARNFYICGDGRSDVAEVGSLYASRVAICAGHMGTLAIQLLLCGNDVDLG